MIQEIQQAPDSKSVDGQPVVQPDTPENSSEEILIRELLAITKPTFFTALAVGVLCGVGAYFYSKTLDREYEASARYTINSSSQASDISGSLGILRSGSGGTSENSLARDKIQSRDFIIKLFKNTDIDEDPYITGENDKPGLIQQIRILIFGSKPPPPPERLQERMVGKIRNMTNVTLNSNGIIDVTVTHDRPDQAAKVANAIVESHIEDLWNTQVQLDGREIALLEKRLTDAQAKFDEALKASRTYAVENSIRSKEDLNANSQNLAQFRKEVERLDALLSGVRYLRQHRAETSSDQIDASRFFAAQPAAFTLLQRELNWSPDSTRLPLPPAARIDAIERSFSEQRKALQRTLVVMESEAVENATAVGKLEELQREIGVRQTLYNNLFSRLETRDLGAMLRGEQAEWIQKATSPLEPSYPRVESIILLGLAAGILAVILLTLANALLRGTLHSYKRIAQAFKAPLLVTGVRRIANPNRRSFVNLAKNTSRTDHSTLLDLVLMLRGDGIRKVSLLGAPKTVVVRDLSVVLANHMAAESNRIVIVDLGEPEHRGTEMNLYGTLKEVKQAGGLKLYKWRGLASNDKNAQLLDVVLDEIETQFDQILFACSSLERGGLRNEVALQRSDRVLILASPGITTQNHVERVHKILARLPAHKFDLVSA